MSEEVQNDNTHTVYKREQEFNTSVDSRKNNDFVLVVPDEEEN